MEISCLHIIPTSAADTLGVIVLLGIPRLCLLFPQARMVFFIILDTLWFLDHVVLQIKGEKHNVS